MASSLLPSGDSPWSRGLRQACLVATSVVATGAAGMAVVELWRRSQRLGGERRPRSSRGISLTEVAKHDSLDDAWLVIQDQIYDITPFVEDHPGGKWLLLAFAGSDGTKAFESMGHSAVARKQMRAMHVGTLQTGTMVKEAPRTIHHGRLAELTGGPAAEEAVKGALWEVSDRGFLPTRDPVGIESLEDTPFRSFVELADFLPSLGFTGQLRQKIDNDAQLQARMLQCSESEVLSALSEDQLERAFAAVTYTIMAYWRGGTLDYSMGLTANCIDESKVAAGGTCAISDDAMTLPPCLSRPVLALSKILGRPPMIDYASSVLYNWERIDKDGPISMANTRCVFRLTGLIDEEWFFKTHVIIEAEATHVVSAILAATRAFDDSELLTQLVALEEALWRVVRACLPIMYERVENGTPNCSEQIFYQIIRPLIKSGPLTFDTGESGEEKATQFLSGPSGAMSSLLPCIDAALGIKMTSEKLRQAMSKFTLSMPKRHQEFLQELAGSINIRQRILCGRPAGGEHSEHYDALVRSFNRVISRVLDFRWQHWQYVKNFVMKPGNISHAVGTGGTSFDYLQQHITDTEKARLQERNEGHTRVATPGPPPRVPDSPQHPTHEFWSVDGENGLLAREPLVSPAKSTWASSLTPAMFSAFEVAWDIALRLPALCVSDGPVVEVCANAAPKLAPLQDDRALVRLSEGAREHLMATLCHIAAGCTGVGTNVNRLRKPPSCIDKPLRVLARSVGRPPRLDFTELILGNWDFATIASARNGKAQDSRKNGDAAEPTLPQLHVVWRFIGAPDEEWYRSVHIVMHREARDVISAIRVGHVAMLDQNDSGVVGSLEQISAWLNKFCDYFDSHFESKGSRTEAVMIRRLEPFISRGNVVDLTWEETASWVYCSGSSVLAPAIHAFLGVECCPREASHEAERVLQTVRRTFEEGRVSMPRNHRAFLEDLEKPGVSIRQYCFRRFGARLVSVEVLHDLEVAYNDVLHALGRFMSRRVHLVSRFFPQFASNFGTLHSDYEAQQRGERLQLLKMRQRVSRRLER